MKRGLRKASLRQPKSIYYMAGFQSEMPVLTQTQTEWVDQKEKNQRYIIQIYFQK